jgi:tape measure domain-containing protein
MNVGTLEIKLLANIARLQADMDKASGSVDRAMKGIDKSVGIAKRAFGGLLTAVGGAQVLKALDEYKKFDAQLKLSARTANEYAEAYGNVVRIARRAQSDISAGGVFYARLTNNLRDFGTAQGDIAKIAESVTLALRVNNATVQETNSVMLQLSQSFGSGRLNGQEFLAVAEGAPPLLRQLAKSMNVTFGELKNLSAQGKITSQELQKAWSDPKYLASLREQVKEVGTVSSAFVVLMNNIKLFLGEMDKGVGATKLLQMGIIGLADSLDLLLKAGLAVGAIAFGRLTASMYETVKAQQAAIAADTAARAKKVQLAQAAVLLAQEQYRVASATGASTLALNNNAAATTNAARAAAALSTAQARLATTSATAGTALRAMGSAVAFLGGPIGIAIGLVVLFGDKIVEWMNKTRGMTPALQSINDELERQNRLRKEGININDPMAEEKSKAAQLQEQIVQLTQARERYQAIAKDPTIATAMEKQRLVGLGVANTQLIQTRAQEAARGTSEKLRAAYDLLTKASAALEEPVNKNIATFSSLTEDLKLTSAQKAEYVRQSEAIIAAAKREGISQIELGEALAKLRQKLMGGEIKASQKSYDDQVKEVMKSIEIEDEAREAAEIARYKEETKRAKEAEDEKIKEVIKSIEIEDDARQAAEIERYKDEVEAAKKAAKAAADAQIAEFKRIQESLSRTISNALFDGFENGKSFLENFKDVAIRTLKTIFVQPFIERIIAGPLKTVLGALGSLGITDSAFAGQTGLVAAGGGDIFGKVSEGLSSLNTNVVGSIEKLGVFLSSGNGGLADKLGGFLGQYSSQIASGLAFVPAAFSLLKGDLKGAAFQGGGAAIGLALGGPVGGAIGSFLGGALGSAFGGKTKNPRIGAAVTGTYTTATDKYLQTAVGKGGAKKFDASNVAAIGSVNEALLTQLGGFLDQMGVIAKLSAQSGFYTKTGKKSIGQFSGAINGKGFGFTEVYGKDDDQAFQKYVDSALGIVMVQAIKASPLSVALKQLFTRSTDKAVVLGMMNAVVALNNEQTQLADVYSLTVDQAAKVATATGLAGQAQIDFVKKLTTSVQTVGSVLIQTRDRLTEGFTEQGGGSLPSTLKQFDDALKAVDKSTQEGIKTFTALFGLREQFAAFTQSIDQLKGGVNQSLMPFLTAQERSAIQQAELAKLFESLEMSVPGSIEELVELGKNIDFTTKEGLDLASVFPSLIQAFQAANLETQALTNSLNELDPNKFRTLVDFTRAQRYLESGIPMSSLPSYDVGTSFVPKDGPAMIHRGERILTAEENAAFSQGGGEMVAEMRALREDVRAGQVAIAIATQKTAKLLDKFDKQGILIAELDNDGNPYVVPVEIVP